MNVNDDTTLLNAREALDLLNEGLISEQEAHELIKVHNLHAKWYVTLIKQGLSWELVCW